MVLSLLLIQELQCWIGWLLHRASFLTRFRRPCTGRAWPSPILDRWLVARPGFCSSRPNAKHLVGPGRRMMGNCRWLRVNLCTGPPCWALRSLVWRRLAKESVQGALLWLLQAR